MKVAVLKGGRSLERAVSLRSGARVEDALDRLGHEAVPIDVGSDLIRTISGAKPDVAFIALHGRGGEDGTIQELLEIAGIPYTGPKVAACMRCMDKIVAKHAIRAAGIPTPDWAGFSSGAFNQLGAADSLPMVEEQLGMPLIVKPAGQGSSLGVRLVTEHEQLTGALVAAFSYDDRVLLEAFADGRELAVSVLGSEALPIVEALPKDAGLFDFEARYAIGKTEYVCPADLDGAEADLVRTTALDAYRALGCSGFGRVDLILTPGGPQVLEINAIPGFTDTSLLPQAAEAAGISFEKLVEAIIAEAVDRCSAIA